MTTAAVTLVALIGCLFGLQALRVGRDRNAPPSRGVRVTIAALGGGAGLLAAPQLYSSGYWPGQDPAVTAVALIALVGWFIGLQTLLVGRDRTVRPSRWVLVTIAVLVGGAALLAVPQFFLMVT